MPKGAIYCPRKTFSMCMDEVFDVGIDRISLEYPSEKTINYWFILPFLVVVREYPWQQSEARLLQETLEKVLCF